MKLRILSDIHSEFLADRQHKIPKILDKTILPELPDDKDTVLIIAGDLGSMNYPTALVKTVDHIAPRFKHVVYVAGNHEYYGTDLQDGVKEIHDKIKHHDNVIFDNFEKIPFAYLGDAGSQNNLWMATLWSDYNKRNALSMLWSQDGMTDHNQIKGLDTKSKVRAEELLLVHDYMVEQLVDGVQLGDVVVTHHAPSFLSVPEEYRGDKLNGSFASELSDLIQDLMPALWVHGHCLDKETEILTTRGWLKHSDLREKEKVYSYNSGTGELEEDEIKDLIYRKDYCGKVYEYVSKTINLSVTYDHNMVGFNSSNKTFIKESASNFFKRGTVHFIKSGVLCTKGVGLSLKMLELYIAIVADGSLSGAKVPLVRFQLIKERKIIYVSKLLDDLGIGYKIKPRNKNGAISINFKVPRELDGFNIKGLDRKLLDSTPKEVAAILRGYENTDGYLNNKCTVIFTSKKEEADLLQELFTINGYTSTCHTRVHGFSNKEGHSLYVSPKKTVSAQLQRYDNLKVRIADKELFWCVAVRNQNFFIRRKGKIVLIGNTHTNSDYTIGMTRVVCNPVGYHPNYNKGYNNKLIIEV